jgi:hypothetical protein
MVDDGLNLALTRYGAVTAVPEIGPESAQKFICGTSLGDSMKRKLKGRESLGAPNVLNF